ncbi:flavin reductase family protein [Tundrisphaera sp. TA3]|uniref:flavin reductase family protein n=1 Tax=Tundrisphaera sp. TA3 TaxID=3435775 RepID=UPI003EB855C7
MEIDPQEMPGDRSYRLVVGCVVPRPIAVVSTLSPEGHPNVAPFSYFTIAGHDPLSLTFCVGGPKSKGVEKDTLRNARFPAEGGLGEFIVHVADESYALQITRTGEPIPYGESEFHHAGLTPAPAHSVRPHRIAEAAVAFECVTTHIVPVGNAHLVVGRVVHIFVRDDIIDDRMQVDPDRLAAIGRMSGNDYVRTRDRFEARHTAP